MLPDMDRIKELLAVTGSFIRPGGLELTERAVEFCRFGPGSRVADIGCGVGGSLKYLRQALHIDGLGIEPSAALLDAGRRSPGATLIQGVAEGLPLKDGCLDGILCECVASLIQDLDSALSEFRRVLKPGGSLVISDLYARSPACERISARAFGRFATRTKEEITGLLPTHRFSLLLWEDHTDELKELAAQLILTHGSVDGLRKALCGDDGTRNGRLLHLPASPGYFLMIAHKFAGG
jgi:SAM-dependent methyltransferase